MIINEGIIRGIYKADSRYWFDAYGYYNFGDGSKAQTQNIAIVNDFLNDIKRPNPR